MVSEWQLKTIKWPLKTKVLLCKAYIKLLCKAYIKYPHDTDME